ncbi:MAG: amino acid adenylation domain-containing protein [Pyrinomonadaceae bacterium]
MDGALLTRSGDPARLRTEWGSLVGLLRARAQSHAGRTLYSFLSEELTAETSLTYAELDEKARAVGAWLQEAGAAGKPVLLLFPAGLEYIAAFFGCLYAGAAAVPAYPPSRNRNINRLLAIVKDARPSVVLTTQSVLSKIEPRLNETPELKGLRWTATDSLGQSWAGLWREPDVDGETLAFLQYTSGSTAAPKGVMVTHGNLLHNEELIRRAFDQSEESVIVGWLPLFHDMGLIGNVLQPLYVGARCVLMSPTAFLQSPFGWLEAISRYRATTSGGPNFAYDFCVRKVTPAQRETLDLSSWEVAFDGAEPVRAETLERFCAAFGPCGFRREAFFPCYGLAEATLFVSGGPKGGGPRVGEFRRSALERNEVLPASDDGQDSRSLVSCGDAPREQQVRVVDPESLKQCPAGRVGEIWVTGASVARGYWNRPEETERVFGVRLADTGEGPYLRTGDLGFVDGDRLFVTGRLKDLIIIRGRNCYPEDIEQTAGRCDESLRPGEGAAFSVEVAGEERLVVVHEVVRGYDAAKLVDAAENIRKSLAEEYDLQPHAVSLIKPGTLLKTSSGKIQRQATKRAFVGGKLEVLLHWSPSESREDEAASATPGAAPTGLEATKEWIASKVAAVLGLSRSQIDADEPITSHGLDSLAVVELAHGIESGLGVTLPFTALMQGLSISGIAARVISEEARTIASRAAAPSTLSVQTPSPTRAQASSELSHGQAALWFLHRLAPDNAAYNVVGAARVRGSVDVDALRKALQTLIERHPQLRSSFRSRGGGPVRVVEEGAEVAFRVEEMSGADDEELRRRVAEEARRPFDLENGPVFRAVLFDAGAGGRLLIITAHHIVTDLWSLAVLVKELGAAYSAHAAGAAIELAAPEAGYEDYVGWQRRVLAGPRGARLLGYWRGQLSGELPVLALPTDYPRPPVQTYEGGSVSTRLGPETVEALQALARRHQTTLHTVLLAAYFVLLRRHTGQEDLIVGSPTSGRVEQRFESVVGYFINPVPVRAEADGSLTFREFVSRLKETTLAAFEHQDYPFPLLVDGLCPDRDPSRSPIFQTTFVFEQSPPFADSSLAAFVLGEAGARLEAGALTLESFKVEQAVSQFDLSMVAARVGGALAVELQYNRDLFKATTMGRMLGRFGALIDEIVARPEQRIAEIPILTEEERHLLEGFNATEESYPAAGGLHQLFEAQAAKTPRAEALVYEGGRLSYGELNARANRLAHHLMSLGVGPETRVAVMLERAPELVVSLLAVLKAGGAYLPLDPAYPTERLSFMLEDTGAGALICREESAARLPAHTSKVVSLESHADSIARQSDHDPPARSVPSNLSHVIYTSGSTGRPKGVAIEHGCVVNFLNWARQTFTPEELAGVLASTSVCFDLSVFEIFAPLSSGGSVVLAADALHLATHEAAARVTLINTVPSAMAELLRLKAVGPGVRAVNLAGEALKNSLVQQTYAETHVGRVLNLYGPTEYTTYTTGTEVVRGARREPTIGRPIANTVVHILDEELRPVPVGVIGEICVGGAGLARCYLNRPEMTAERFVPDHVGGRAGARLYRTGDLGRYLESGDIEYLGRKDHQVKVRGYRIELGEIEAVLLRHPEINEAVVVAGEDRRGEKRVVAYVVAGQGRHVAAGELRDHLRQTLPGYMVPQTFVTLDALPLTRNGKVDRKALPAPDADSAAGERVKPSGPVEEVVANVWAEVLGLEGVDAADNFFDIGGHSLRAVQVVSRLSDLFKVELPVRLLFEAPTVQSLAAVVGRATTRERHVARPPIERASRGVRPPLSYAQQRMWFLQRMEPDNPFYNLPAAVRLRGALDVDALLRTLTEVVRRHEVLRTRFEEADGEPVQVVEPAAPLPLPLTDLSGLEESEREAEARRLTEEEALKPFDIGVAPLIRAGLLRLSSEEHVVLVTIHHIAGDGWSTGVLTDEVRSLYGAYARGEESPLAELEIQYADYAAWQRGWLRGDELEGQLSFWRERLGGDLPVLDLPADRPRPAVQTYRGSHTSVTLSPEVEAGLRALGRREGVTLFMTLLAAFDLLLHRYTGRRDILVGAPVAGRARKETEGLIGLFVNTLVLRAEVGGDLSFRDLLARVREATLSAYAHQDVPFEKLVEELRPERSLSHSPLFQVAFALQNAPAGRLELPGLETLEVSEGGETAKFDLTVTVAEGGEGLRVSWNYNTDLFDASTVERMARHYARVLKAVALDPERRVSEVELLSAEERRQLLVEWNPAAGVHAPPRCIHELFDDVAAKTPDAVAVVHAGEELTYAELNARADRLSRYLRSLGVGPESMVGLLLERSAEMVVAILGVLKAGGAYVPLDPEYPRERIDFILEDAGVSLLLTQRRLRGRAPVGVAVCCVDDDADDAFEAHAPDSLAKVSTPDNTAYVIYTSGSTGRPKGVQITHANVARLFAATREWFRFGPRDVWTMFHSYAFDFSVWELWGALLHGGRVVVVPFVVSRSPEAFYELMRDEGVTVLNQTPSAFLQLIQAAEPADEAERLPLRLVIFGGEALEPQSLRPWFERYGDRTPQLVNMYGITETTVHVTYRPLSAEDLRPGAGSMIGRPIPDLQVYVLDEYRNLCPVGVPGELHVGGRGLARGYLNRPALTAERFVANPFGEGPGARLYRSGDLARFLPNGDIEYLGRIDHQVKLRGHRIEPGEIEAALAGHPSVSAALVTVREVAPGDERLVAYVVAHAGANAEELKGHLKERLPAYMAPGAWVFLDALPLTRNGKVDRKALPDPDITRRDSGEEFEPPRTQVEEVLASIWSQVLGAERVGRSDNFFALGGHSLLATRIISRVRESFRVELPVRSLFESPTLAKLAEQIRAATRAPSHAAAPPITPRGDAGHSPLSYAQQRLWFLDRLTPGGSVYNIPFGVRLAGALNVAALEQGCGEIIRRQESLRTNIVAAEGEPLQVVAPARSLRLPLINLSRLAEADKISALRGLAEKEARRPFDLAKDSPLRAALVRLSDEEHVLLVTMHHVVSDGWSMGIFSSELVSLYKAFGRGEASPLTELSVSYADYSAWQREWLTRARLAGQLGYWKAQLSDAPSALELPTDYPRPAVQSHRGAVVPLSLSPELTGELKATCREHAVTPFMALAAAFSLMLSRYSRQSDVCVGTPVAGRTRLETEQLIGLFVNTLVLRTRFPEGQTVSELLAQVREVTLQAHAHQDVPFEMLVDELRPERSLSRGPLFQAAIALEETPAGGARIEGLRLSEVEVEAGSEKFDLTLIIEERSSGFAGRLSYATDLFERETAERMARHFERLVGEMVKDAGRPADEVEMLGPAERRRLLYEWNDTGRDFGAQCVHELVAAQAARRPEAVAVVCGGEHVTYAELDARANRLANYLRRLGVATEGLVGVYLESSAEMLVALLGILKAGGAYLPLDTQYPQPRLALMLEDARPSAVITQGGLKRGLPRTAAHVVCIDADWPDVARESDVAPLVEVGADNLCYVTYTSGSTGTPKGVQVTHRGVLRLLVGVGYVGLDERQVILQAAPLAFDASTFEIWGALVHGGRCVMFEGRVPTAPELAEVIERNGVRTMWLTAALFNAVVDEDAGALRGLRQLLVGGEALSVRHILRARAALPRTRLVNGYGPTESTTFACCHDIDGMPEGARSVPIGQPISNTRVYVLDGRMRPVPIGVTGELYIGGDGLARGYLNRPDLTAERFVPHPFGACSGERLYRTGDLVRRLAGGEIEYLGRTDRQVKIRGFRIEPGEVEAALAACPGVSAAAVVVREDESGRKCLVGYVAGEVEADTAALRAHLQSGLPSYMVPASLTWLGRMHLTPNGKIDRDSLPEPARDVGRDGYVAPRTPAEKTLAAIWEEVLKVERVGADDNFFDLGGDSILSIHVGARAGRAGLKLTPQQFFREQTLARLARAAEEATPAQTHSGAARAVEPARDPRQAEPARVELSREELSQLVAEADVDNVAEVYPLTPFQQGLLFHVLNAPDAGISLAQQSYTLRGELDAAAFRAAFESVVGRHQVLRTAFVLSSQRGPLQVVYRKVSLPWAEYDWRGLTPAEESVRMDEMLHADFENGFDLSRAPLSRMALVRKGEDLYEFVWSFHHLIIDGSSSPIILKELLAFYRASRAGRAAELERPVRYSDYIAWLQRQSHEEAESYWRRSLARFHGPTPLGVDRMPLPGADEQQGYGEETLLLDEAETSALRSYAARHRLTLNTLIQGAWALLLSRRSGADDVLFGSVVSGRTADFPRVESAVGVFLNTLPVRVRVPAEGELAAWLKALQLQQSEARRFEYCSLASIHGWSEIPRGQRLFESMLTFQNIPLDYAQSEAEGLKVVEIRTTERTDAPLALVVEPGPRMLFRLAYQRSRFDASTAERILDSLRRFLSEMSTNPGATLLTLSAHSETERQLLINSFNQSLSGL